MKSKSEHISEQLLLGTIMAIRDKNKDAAIGGLIYLLKHLGNDGELPTNLVTNLLDYGMQ